jgi:hypothetical protein
MRFFLGQIHGFFFALAPLFVRAGGDEVVVIYNKRLPESKVVAEHYAKCGRCRRANLRFRDLTTNEEMSRDEFRDSLQMPLASRLEVDKLWRFGSVTNAATNGQPDGRTPRR